MLNREGEVDVAPIEKKCAIAVILMLWGGLRSNTWVEECRFFHDKVAAKKR